MKIGMIAMSGIRAANPELTKRGLTLPGVVERNRIVASLPSLSLLTLAALTPEGIEIDYREIEDLRTNPEIPMDYDLVALATFSAQVKDAYQLADRFRAAGVPVVMGGLHAMALPDEVQKHATTVAVGEGEVLWPRIMRDFLNGGLAARYEQEPGEYFNLADAPMPRYELLDVEKYNRLTVQTSRGCPHLCDFCAGSILLTPRYQTKPPEQVIAEIRRIKDFWPEPFIEFADDNSFVDRKRAKVLLTALKDEGIKWFTEVDISIAREPELLDLMKASGCKQVLIGLESPIASGLDGLEMRRNWKLKVLGEYEQGIRAIQSRGITVNGCFILGLDGHTDQIFDSVYDFIDRTNLFEAQITVLTPFPGTPLYQRLEAQGRILEPGAWEKCTLFDVNHQPTRMSPACLQEGLMELAERIYEPDFVYDRRRRFFEVLHHNGGAANGIEGN